MRFEKFYKIEASTPQKTKKALETHSRAFFIFRVQGFLPRLGKVARPKAVTEGAKTHKSWILHD
jgi:hypothetical protein